MASFTISEIKPITAIKVYKLYAAFFSNERLAIDIHIKEEEYIRTASLKVTSLMDDEVFKKFYAQVSYLIADEEHISKLTDQDKLNIREATK